MTFVIVRRKKDGRLIEIPEANLASTLKQGFELVSEAQLTSVLASPAIETIILLCPLCGYEAKNDKALRMHKMKKHP